MHNKPSGKNGIARVKINPNSYVFVPIILPLDKASKENYFVERFVQETKKVGFKIHSYKANQENDFDFILNIGNHEDVYLELKEVLPQITEKGSPYETRNTSINNYDYANSVAKEIVAYSKKYSSDKPLHLLLYTSDYKFALSDIATMLLKYFLKDQKLIFEYIFLYTPIDQTNGEVKLIYPSEQSFDENFNPEKYKDSICIPLDPAGFTLL